MSLQKLRKQIYWLKEQLDCIRQGLVDRTSQLINDGSDNTSRYVEEDELSTVATTGQYSDLLNLPVFKVVENEYQNITSLYNDQVNQTDTFIQYVLDTSSHSEVDSGEAYFEYLGTTNGNESDYRLLSDQESAPLGTVISKTSDIPLNDGEDGTSRYIEENELAEVATSGSYNDLNDKPFIPVNTSDLNNDGENGADPFITLNEIPDIPEYELSPIDGSNQVDLLKDGVVVSTIDLTPYLDDTNLARITEGILDSQTGVVTFTRDDNSTFTLNLSDLIDIQVQADWNEADNSNPAFIKNKPQNTSDFNNDGEGNGEPFIGANSLIPNVVVRGLQNDVSTLQQFVTTYFQPLAAGGTFTAQQVEDNFSTFRIKGDTISFIASGVDFYFKPRFGTDGNIGENCTHFYDYSGKLKSLPFQQWRGSTNIQEIILEGAVSLGSSCLENCPNLTKLIAPNVTNITNTVINCTSLTTFDFTNVRLINGGGLKGTKLPSTINEFMFPNVTELGGQGTFSNAGIVSAYFPRLKKMASPFRLGCPELVTFKAPMLEEITGAGVFWDASSLEELDFPLLKTLFTTNPVTGFWGCTSLTLLNIPNCTRIGSTNGDDGDMFDRDMSQLTVNINRFLETSNSGNIEPEVQDMLSRNATVNFVDVFQGIFIQDGDGINQFKTYDNIQFEDFEFDIPNKKIKPPIIVPQFGVTDKFEVGFDALGTNTSIEGNKLTIDQIGADNSNPTTFDIHSQAWGGGGRSSKLTLSVHNTSRGKVTPLELLYNLAKFIVNIEALKVITDNGYEVDVEFANNITNTLLKVNDPAGNNLSITNQITSPNYRLEFKVGRGGAGWNAGYDFFVRDGLNPEFKILEMKSSGGGTSTLKGSFKMDKLDLSELGSFSDDSAAATGGVSIGFAYINSSTGSLQRRLT